MVAPENLDLVVQVRILTGQLIYESFQSNYSGGGPRDSDEIRDAQGVAQSLR